MSKELLDTLYVQYVLLSRVKLNIFPWLRGEAEELLVTCNSVTRIVVLCKRSIPTLLFPHLLSMWRSNGWISGRFYPSTFKAVHTEITEYWPHVQNGEDMVYIHSGAEVMLLLSNIQRNQKHHPSNWAQYLHQPSILNARKVWTCASPLCHFYYTDILALRGQSKILGHCWALSEFHISSRSFSN